MRNLEFGVLLNLNRFQRHLTFQGFRSFSMTLQSLNSENKYSGEAHSSGTNGNHSQQDNEKKIENKILTAALPFVLEYGWTKNAIAAGAEAVGYPGVAHGLFPHGGAHLVNHFYAGCNQKLVEHLKLTAEDPNRKMSTPAFIVNAVEYRLRLIIPYVEKWPQALGIMSLPQNIPASLANFMTLIDDICYYAGDRSVDFRWYTRRGTLAGIYKLTELFMIQDRSDDCGETWLFLRRRIDDASILHTFVQQLEEMSGLTRDVAAAAFVTAQNILGLNKGFR